MPSPRLKRVLPGTWRRVLSRAADGSGTSTHSTAPPLRHAGDLEQPGGQVGPALGRVAVEPAVDQVLGHVDAALARVDGGGLVLEDPHRRVCHGALAPGRVALPAPGRPRPPRRTARCPRACRRRSSSRSCRRGSGRRRAPGRPARSAAPRRRRPGSPSSRPARTRRRARGRWPCRRRRCASGSPCRARGRSPRATMRELEALRQAHAVLVGRAPRAVAGSPARSGRDSAVPNSWSQKAAPSDTAATPPTPRPMNSRRRIRDFRVRRPGRTER